MELLKQFAGVKDDSCVREIEFTSGTYKAVNAFNTILNCDIVITSEVVFSNGCRAPPWRQVLGDICYIKVVPCDGADFYITASTEGYFVNKVDKKIAL